MDKHIAHSLKNQKQDIPIKILFREKDKSYIPANNLSKFVVRLLSSLNVWNLFSKRLQQYIKKMFENPYSVSITPASLTSQEYECLLYMILDC